jgi:hypothetical protein
LKQLLSPQSRDGAMIVLVLQFERMVRENICHASKSWHPEQMA